MVDQLRAMKLAGDLAVSYPGRNITEENAVGWAREFLAMTENEARQVVELLSKRSDDPPSRKRITDTLDEVRQKTMSPRFDHTLCVFMDGVECRNCGEIHGHRLSEGQVLHGLHHLRALLSGDEDERDAALRPEGCACGYTPPAGVDVGAQLGQAVFGATA